MSDRRATADHGPAGDSTGRDLAGRRRLLVPLAASGVSGLLLAVAFPPLDLGPVALVALVPLLWAWREAGPARAALFGFVFGLCFFTAVMYWIWYFGVVAIVPLMVVLSCYTAATGAIVGSLGRLGIRSAWLTAAAWVVLEQLRGRWPLGGLPWAEVGVALHDLPVARALASWGGVPLVTFMVVAVNGLLLDVGLAAWRRDRRRVVLAGGGVAVLAAVAAIAGVTWSGGQATGELRYALLQGNDRNRDLTDEELDARYLPESHLALADGLDGDYDLIVFPESSLDEDPEVDERLRERLVELAREHDALVLANALVDAPGDEFYNTNLVYDRQGDLVAAYAKQRLVPFGEYVPFRSWLGFVDALDQIPVDYRPGDERVLFEVGGRPVGSVICYESAFGPLVRNYARDGAEAIVVSTNNRSYRRSANSEQHVAMSQMRAAETGRPVIHASISGVTAVFDADGAQVGAHTELFERTVVSGTVTTRTGQTPFVRYGYWVLWGSVAGLAAAFAVGYRRRRGAALGTVPVHSDVRDDRSAGPSSGPAEGDAGA